MSTEQNKAIARRHFEEVWNKGDMAAADAIYAPDYQHHPYGPTDQAMRSREEFKQYVAQTRLTDPDAHMTIEDMIAEGDKVVTHWTATSTHTSEIMGVAPTGKRLTFTGIDIARIVDGKIVEDWNAVDEAGFLQQVGALPKVG